MSLSKYYVGHTHALDKRIKDHNVVLSRHTKHGSPWDLIKYFECASKSEAIKLETKIKKREIRRFLDDLKWKGPL